MRNKIRSYIDRLTVDHAARAQLARIQEALGRIELRQTQHARSLDESEFSVFSQWGEDGIIQHLIRNVEIASRRFVEFGVQDYVESNTRFLAANDRWSGLVIDGDAENVARIRAANFYWRSDVSAVSAFVTRENINQIIGGAGFTGDIGLLSIDIDGNDYWIWEAIDVVDPSIVVVEYNSRFGPERAVTVPYDPTFTRETAHYSNIYYGASLAALASLAERKGYALVGCNRGGNNAFFVRKDLLRDPLSPVSAAAAFVPSRFRESRDADGRLAFLSAAAEQALLEGLPLVHVG
jgi:hypothetical protein